MAIGSDGSEQPRILYSSPLGPIKWEGMPFIPEVMHPEMEYLRKSDYLTQYINLCFGSPRIISDLESRKSYFRQAFVRMDGDETLLEHVESAVREDRFGPNEEWSDGYRQYWFDLAELYATKTLLEQGGNEELLALQKKAAGSKKMQWISSSLDLIPTRDGAKTAATELHKIAYEIAPLLSVDADVDSWRDGARQAYEDFLAWVVNP